MVQSIRWRLVMGTMLLTLLTVSAVGVVALLLMQRYMVQQERAYLTSNAQAIAQQAADFMAPMQVAQPVAVPLQQLAQTAAFLGDVTVRIVDDRQMPLADSADLAVMAASASTTSTAAIPLYFRVAAPPALQVERLTHVEAGPVNAPPLNAPPVAGVHVPGADAVWSLEAQTTTLTSLALVSTTTAIAPMSSGVGEGSAGQTTNVIVVQKSPSLWGDRLIFEAEAVPAGMHATISATLPLGAAQVVPGMAAMAAVPAHDEAQYGVVAVNADSGEVVSQEAMWHTEEAAADEVIWTQPVAVAGRMAEPTFLQAVGFEAVDSVTAPIQTGGATVGFGELARPTTLTDEPLAALRRVLGIAAGASSLLAIGVGLVMSRTLTSPIQNLAQAAAAMSSGDLTARAPVQGRDELASLARQFNQMADALHHSFAELAAERDTLRRFVADASHELRTPITALRTFNELLQGPAQGDRVAQAEFLAESHLQIARLEWITRNLLDLSRWDGGMATLARTEVEVGELVMATAAPFRTLAQERQIELKVVVPATPVVALVDAPRLGMAVGNLLDNALKFTPCGGKVEVGVCDAAGQVKIWVADTGMGIEAAELPHIFERFYRSPRATQVGSGLGLAIVERIVKAHGATVAVESEVGVGSRFMLHVVQ